jgi:hypothetical protein
MHSTFLTLALSASEKDISAILSENLGKPLGEGLVLNRYQARWEFAKRMMANAPSASACTCPTCQAIPRPPLPPTPTLFGH